MGQDKNWTFKDRVLLLFGSFLIILIVLLAFKYIFPVMAPFIIAYAVAVLIERPVEWLARHFHGRRTLASSIVVIILGGVLIAVTGYIMHLAAAEVRAFIRNSDYYFVVIRQQTARICLSLDRWIGINDGCCMDFICGCAKSVANMFAKDGGSDMAGKVIKVSFPVLGKTAYIIGAVFVSLISVVYLSNVLKKVRNWKKTTVFFREAAAVSESLRLLFNVYFKVEGHIFLINSAVCIAGLFVIKNPYAVVLGILIGLIDAFPIFGTGTVLIPWSVILLLLKDIMPAAVLITVYIITYFVREIMESKCLGDKLNIEAFTMMVIIFAGFILYGVMGFILGPVSYCIIKALIKYYRSVLESQS